jgi:hypothetical protein
MYHILYQIKQQPFESQSTLKLVKKFEMWIMHNLYETLTRNRNKTTKTLVNIL